MGKNTPERQDFIIDNLRIEKDIAEELALERLRKLNEGLNKDKESNDE
jgi:topoisomerase-4 subunit B